MAPAISVIIVNLNGEAYLGDCLGALSAQTFRDFDVVVVDNGSTDGSLSLINRDFPWVRLVSLEENTGFARGNNLGIEASSSKYVATLNNDAIPKSGWLAALHRTAEGDGAVGMVASKILLGREGGELDSAGMLVYPDGMSRQRGRGEEDRGQFDGIEDVLFPSACAALYRRDMLKEIGYFDEDFFSYCEDADLGLRARLAGWKAAFAPDAVVRHLYSSTGGKYSAFKAYHVERNRFWVLLKNFPISYIIVSPFYTLWRYLFQFYGLLSGRGSAARFAESEKKGFIAEVVLRVYLDLCAGIIPALRKRRKVWRLRKISRREYKRLLRIFRIRAGELVLTD